jgi:hypothetical protein
MNNIDLSAITGACLGSFFYMLMRLQPFLENRTFDPKYNSAYITRLVTGAVAGVILAYVVKAYVVCKPCEGNAILCLSPAIIGILGGFSAEAVEQVLQRLVDVLLSTIRGDNSGQVQAKATAQQTAKFADVRDKLDDIGKAKTDEEKTAAIDAAKALLKRSAS